MEGNFEQLRGYLEQLQEAVARGQGIGGEDLLFELQGGMEEDDDDEDGGEDEEGDGKIRYSNNYQYILLSRAYNYINDSAIS